MMNNLLNILDKLTYPLCTLIVCCFLYSAYTDYVHKEEQFILSTKGTVTANDVKSVAPVTEADASKISKKINSTIPVNTIVTQSKPTTSEVKAIVKDSVTTNKNTSVIVDDSKEHVTNVFAIDATKKAQHGVSIVTGYSNKAKDFSLGVAYRNRRTIVGASKSHKGVSSLFIGYEVAQW